MAKVVRLASEQQPNDWCERPIFTGGEPKLVSSHRYPYVLIYSYTTTTTASRPARMPLHLPTKKPASQVMRLSNITCTFPNHSMVPAHAKQCQESFDNAFPNKMCQPDITCQQGHQLLWFVPAVIVACCGCSLIEWPWSVHQRLTLT